MAGLGQRMSNQQKIETVDRETTVLELARAGYTFREIGDHIGITGSGAYRAFKRGLEKTIKPAAEEYRALHLARLETIFKTHYPAMRRGDFAATDRCLKALAGISALLGLDAPKEVKVAHEMAALAGRVAEDMNLNSADVLAEAERILTAVGSVD